MTVREFIEKLQADEIDPEESIYTMQDGVRVPPEIFVSGRLGVVIM